MCTLRKRGSAIVISFSGIDGAGKTTQIESLCARMKEAGLRIRVIAFWDNVAKLTRLREGTSHLLFKSDKGIGAPSAPINRRDKNVRSWFMSGVRLLLYTLDAVSARAAVKRALCSDNDMVVFDRFIYDQLANLNLRNPAMRAYARLTAKYVPKPHISYLLDADPIQARTRKPEYPVEFLQANRQSYLTLNDLVGGMTVIGPMPIADTERNIFGHILSELSRLDHSTNREIEARERIGDGALQAGKRSRPVASNRTSP